MLDHSPSPGLRLILDRAADCYFALCAAGWSRDDAARIVTTEFTRRVPPWKDYPPEPQPRDQEPPP